MHQAANDGSSVPRRKMRALCLAFAFAIVLRVLSQYAVGILWVRSVLIALLEFSAELQY